MEWRFLVGEVGDGGFVDACAGAGVFVEVGEGDGGFDEDGCWRVELSRARDLRRVVRLTMLLPCTGLSRDILCFVLL